MSLAIMQPYIFPYIGYFHLLDASDKIIFYDDVNYIKGGWINRNKILLNGKEFLFTIPVEDASQNKLINEIKPVNNIKFRNKLYKQVHSAYSKAPYFKQVSDLINQTFETQTLTIADLTINSILSVYQYLGLTLNYDRSSDCSPSTRGLEKAHRLIRITKDEGHSRYINSIGGMKLYSKEQFLKAGIELCFIKSNDIHYKQFSDSFVPGLSIIDVLMFNNVDVVKSFVNQYELI